MKLYDGWMKAFEKRDFDEVMKYYHRDYSFVGTKPIQLWVCQSGHPLWKVC